MWLPRDRKRKHTVNEILPLFPVPALNTWSTGDVHNLQASLIPLPSFCLLKRKILSFWEIILGGRSCLLSSFGPLTQGGQKGRLRHKSRNLWSVISLHFVCFSCFTVTFQFSKLMNSPILKPGFAETLSDRSLGQLFENNGFDSLVKTLQPTSKFH